MDNKTKIRTIPQLYREIVASDPETALTVTTLYRDAKDGKFPVMRAGRKMLVNSDEVMRYYGGGND